MISSAPALATLFLFFTAYSHEDLVLECPSTLFEEGSLTPDSAAALFYEEIDPLPYGEPLAALGATSVIQMELFFVDVDDRPSWRAVILFDDKLVRLGESLSPLDFSVPGAFGFLLSDDGSHAAVLCTRDTVESLEFCMVNLVRASTRTLSIIPAGEITSSWGVTNEGCLSYVHSRSDMLFLYPENRYEETGVMIDPDHINSVIIAVLDNSDIRLIELANRTLGGDVLRCRDLEGTSLWERDIGRDGRGHGSGVSLALSADCSYIFVLDDLNLACLSTWDGSVIFNTTALRRCSDLITNSTEDLWACTGMTTPPHPSDPVNPVQFTVGTVCENTDIKYSVRFDEPDVPFTGEACGLSETGDLMILFKRWSYDEYQPAIRYVLISSDGTLAWSSEPILLSNNRIRCVRIHEYLSRLESCPVQAFSSDGSRFAYWDGEGIRIVNFVR